MESLYYYTARNSAGAVVRGSIAASTESAVLASLRTRSLVVTSLEHASSARGALAAVLHLGPVSHRALVTFFRSFATLVRAGVPMRRSLEVTIDQCADMRLREALSSIINHIENGLSLSDSMARHPREFPRMFVAMVRAGERGGVLDEVLERLASTLERDRATRKRVGAALAYPAVVGSAAFALIIFLLTSIVPMFRSLYQQMHVQLPAITSALITVGAFASSPKLWIGCAFFASVSLVLVARIRSLDAGAVAIEAVLFRVPVLGLIRRKSTVARLARMLGTLLRSGVDFVASLEVVTDVVTSAPYRKGLDSLRVALGEGAGISEPLAQTSLFEPMFIQMIRVGEETGALDVMLLRVAEYYEVDLETTLSALGAMLEPAMILLLGGAVGFIVSAIFIPLYTLIGNIK